MLVINEIFKSIQGESSRAGLPTLFIRTSGCHLRCTYCDTKYAYHDGKKMALEELLDSVSAHQVKNICLTGGEPLLQKEVLPLMQELCDRDYDVSLETCGDLSCDEVDSRVLKVIDVKTPDSGEGGKFSEKNLKLSGPLTEFKFVICSEKDFYWAENFVKENKISSGSKILYSPSFEKIDEQWLAEKILTENSPARLQLQLHKYIWSPDRRGV